MLEKLLNVNDEWFHCGQHHTNYCVCVCTVHIVGRCGGTQFEDRDVTLIIGEASEVGVVDGVEQALKKFKKGEKSLIQVKSKHGYGAEGNTTYNIPPNADLEYEVELRKFEKVNRFHVLCSAK